MRRALLLVLPVVALPNMALAGGLSEAAAERFARQVEAQIAAGNGGAFDAAFDVDALTSKALRGLEAKPETKSGFLDGVRKSVRMGTQVVVSMKGDETATYKFLRTRRGRTGRKTVLFRYISTAGVNYHEFELTGAEGAIRVADAFVFLSGEWLSETLRRSFLPLVAHDSRGFVDRLRGKTSAYIANISKIQQMVSLARAQKPAEAMAVYEGLPKEVQSERTVLILRYGVASQLGDAQYRAAMAAIEAAFPDDASLGFILFDRYFLDKKYDKALAAIMRAEKALGGDAYLTFLEGNVHYEKGDRRAAKAAYERAIDAEPTLEAPYWSRITVTLDEKAYEETSRWLDRAESALGVQMGNLETIPVYEGYAKSAAYRAWKKRRAERAP